MANYQKINKITQFFERDRAALTAMGNCGYVTRDQLKECGITDGRIKNYLHDGYTKAGDKSLGYKLTDKGKELLSKNYGKDVTYNAQSEKHDLGIAEKYFSLNQDQRDTWKNESELREEFSDKLQELRDHGEEELADLYEEMYQSHEISMCDGSYQDENGVETYYEIITNNYGEAEMMAKEALAQIMRVEYEPHRV